MQINTSWIITGLLLCATALAFNADGKDNVALYWGQNSAGSQQSLATYCQSSAVDVVVLSFLYQFPNNGKPDIDFSSACSGSFSDGLAKCDDIANDIQTCQDLGKKVLLSLGGAVGQYGFSSDSEAQDFAGTLWNMFGGGDATERPFGDSVVDGFDLDIENNNPTGYAALATKLREYYSQDSSKTYYISAAPQCVYPDASVGDALSDAYIDFAFVQFYNNPCELDRTFNWNTWENYAETISPNPNIKIYLGLPASSGAASYGYADVSTVQDAVDQIKGSSHFGGIMLWDASQGFANQVGSENYVEAMKSILDSSVGDSPESSISPSSSPATSTGLEPTSSDWGSTPTVTLSVETTSSSSVPVTSAETFAPTTEQSSAIVETPSSFATLSSEQPAVESQWYPESSSVVVEVTSSVASTAALESSTLQTSSAETSEPEPIASTQVTGIVPTTLTSADATSVESTQEMSSEIFTSTLIASTVSSEVTSTTVVPEVEISTVLTSDSRTATVTGEPTTSTTTFSEVTTNTFTPSVPSTLKTVYYSSTEATTAETSTEAPAEPSTTSNESLTTSASATTTSQPQTTGSNDCTSLSGNEKAKCMNTMFEQGLYLGSSTTCTDGEIACSATGEIAICNYGSWVRMMCASGTTCYAYNTGDSVSVSCNFASQKSDFVKRSMDTFSYKHKHNRH